MMALTVPTKSRASIDALLNTEFISLAYNNSLDSTPLRETVTADQGGNLYKFYMAHCICEIISRFSLNQAKIKQINNMRNFFDKPQQITAD